MGAKSCAYCNEQSYMLFPCKQCGKSFCAAHRLPENHGCLGGAAGNTTPTYGMPSYSEQDYAYAKSNSQQSRDYVWEPNITELPANPFDPDSGVVIKGIFWPRGKELYHILIAFAIMFFIGYLTASSIFSGLVLSGIPGVNYTNLERNLFPYLLAIISTSGFLIHEFSHRQVGRRYTLPAKFRLLTFGMLITIIGITMYLLVRFPPFAVPGAVVVIGLENRDQAGKCKVAGPLSNFIISIILLPLVFIIPIAEFEYSILLLLGAYINTFLGVFNMLPVGILDGRNIIAWKKWVWILLMVALVILLIIELFFVSNLTLLLTLKMS